MRRGATNLPLAMDGRMLGSGEGTGVARYAQGLRAALARLGPGPLVLADRPSLSAPRPTGTRMGRWARALLATPRRAHTAAGDPRLLVAPDLFRLAQVVFDIHGRLLPVQAPGPPGIMHWSYPVPLYLKGWRNLYTVHDAIPFTHPELTPIDPRRHRRLLARVAARADAILTVSPSARAEIEEAIGAVVPVIDCGQAVEPAVPDAALPDGLAPDGYLLVVGSVEIRKNVPAILAAYRASGLSLPLVLAGPDGWDIARVAPTIEATRNVVRLPWLPDPVMGTLIARARAVLMPSLAEGFGLPVIEAMALGTAVLASNDGALRETAGGAALSVDPREPGELAAAIRRIATDASLRASLIAAGRSNAQRFTVSRFAERLAAAHARIVAPASAAG